MSLGEMKRDNAIDLFKILGSYDVVLSHLSHIIKNRYYEYAKVTLVSNTIWLEYFLEHIKCFLGNVALVFLLISGALAFRDYDTTDIKKYQKGIIKRFFKPILYISLLYFVIEVVYYYLIYGNILEAIGNCIALVIGYQISDHLWYIYVLFVLLLILPYLKIIKNDLGIRKYVLITLVIFCGSILLANYYDSVKFSFFTLKLNRLSLDIMYLCFFIGGDLLYNVKKDDKNNYKAFLFFIISFLMCFIYSCIFVKYYEDTSTHSYLYTLFIKYSRSNIFVVLSAIFLFLSIKYFDIKINFMSLSSSTYFVYMFHPALIYLYYIFCSIIFNKDIKVLDIDISKIKLFILSLIIYMVLVIVYKMISKYRIYKSKNLSINKKL